MFQTKKEDDEILAKGDFYVYFAFYRSTMKSEASGASVELTRDYSSPHFLYHDVLMSLTQIRQ